jgi:hypothetical protein
MDGKIQKAGEFLIWQPSIITYFEVQEKVAEFIRDCRRTSTGEIPFEMSISNGMKRIHNSFNGQLKTLQ